jgi:uncharacterized membrane protein (UPF0127 family)
LPSRTQRLAPFIVLLVAGCGAKPATPQGFARVGLKVSDRALCAWLADTEALRDRGLMDVGSLGRADAMVFRFNESTNVAFYMYRTTLPLTVVFVSAAGRVSDIVDMEPCPEKDEAKCPRFQASAPYQSAVEVPKGGAASLGFSVGSIVDYRSNC